MTMIFLNALGKRMNRMIPINDRTMLYSRVYDGEDGPAGSELLVYCTDTEEHISIDRFPGDPEAADKAYRQIVEEIKGAFSYASAYPQSGRSKDFVVVDYWTFEGNVNGRD